MSKDAEFFSDLSALLGTPTMGEDERTAILELTRVVAHSSERRFAPLTAYALALTMSPQADTATRARQVQEATLMFNARDADAAAVQAPIDPPARH